jgi:nitroimidazol reductase NimA-like FMN-containing flavoprotein (pyridoxamine 5'-phosphate oxidase superfamily)
MELVDSRTGIHVLDRETCLRLLSEDEVGRLGIVDGGTPLILPVNYALDGDVIVFRTAPGAKLTAGPRAPACFEIDRFDRETRTGWSVLVIGRLEEVTPYQSKAWSRVQGVAVDPWAANEKTHWLRLVPDSITGRQVP